MTWDELMERVRVDQRESAGHLRALENVVGDVGKDNDDLSGDQVGAMLVLLALAVSGIHSAVEHLGVGLDTIVKTARKASEAQEVKSD